MPGFNAFTCQPKHFNNWIKLKAKLHFAGCVRAIKDGDIWWCAVGENIGAEINGKNELFSRPVLIVRKLSRYNFIAVPLTSKQHIGSWYAEFVFKDKKQIAVLSQVRDLSVSRLYKKMGEVSESDLELVRERLCELILKKNIP